MSAEIAIISIRRSRLDQLAEEGNHRARRVRRLKDDPGRFLAVVQLGLTVLGFFASAYAAVNLSNKLADALRTIPAVGGGADGLALLIVTVLLALFTIVFGELVPKSIGLAYAERLAMLVAGPVEWIARVLGPIVWFLTRVTSGITRLLGVSMSSEAQMTAEELKLIVERGGEQGILEAEEEQMINAVIELGDRRLHEVMVPRIAIVAMPVSATLDEAIDLIVEEGHSRVPVYDELIDEVLGILYAKDLLPVLKIGADSPADRPLAACGRRCSCPSRCQSTTSSTSSSGARSTSPSSSTNTAAPPGCSPSRTCSRRSWARSRTSTTSRSRSSCACHRTRPGSTAGSMSTSCPRPSRSRSAWRMPTSTTPSAG